MNRKEHNANKHRDDSLWIRTNGGVENGKK